jgi:urease accessory protein
LVLLDSITSGRQALGEDWDFAKYYSLNEVKVDGKLVAKDVLLLEDPKSSPTLTTQSGSTRIPYRPLREQLAPYSCYAMVLLYGPQVQEAIEDISAQYKHITVYQMKQTPDSLWSFSLLGATSSEGAIVRVAGKESEIVRSCLKTILRHLDVTIGIDTYRRAFA